MGKFPGISDFQFGTGNLRAALRERDKGAACWARRQWSTVSAQETDQEIQGDMGEDC